VVGALYRRADRELALEGGGGPMLIPAGALVKVDVRAANTDPAVAGACPFKVDVRRVVEASKVSDSIMSFSDGPHRCPAPPSRFWRPRSSSTDCFGFRMSTYLGGRQSDGTR
jgi:cytochrome P450